MSIRRNIKDSKDVARAFDSIMKRRGNILMPHNLGVKQVKEQPKPDPVENSDAPKPDNEQPKE